MDHKDPFENKIREILEDHETDYDPKAWARLEAGLAATAVGVKTVSSFRTALIAAGSAILIGGSLLTYAFWDSDDENIAQNTSQPTAKEQVVSNPAAPTESSSFSAEAESGSASATDADMTNLADEVVDAMVEDADLESGTSEQGGQRNLLATFTKNHKSQCPDVPVQFSCQNKANAEYYWDFGDGTTSKEKNPAHIFTSAGTYTVSLSVKSKRTGKVVHSDQQITIHPGIEPKWGWQEGEPLGNNGAYRNPAVQFKLESPDAVKWQWTFDQSRVSDEKNPQHMFTTRGKHNVELYVENQYGCAASTAKQWSTKSDYDLHAPKVFSPNGDGMNDTWIPIALKYSDFNFSLSIVDSKTGAIVFSTNNSDKPWGGTIKHSDQLAQPGEIYMWVADVESYGGVTNKFGGLIRISE